MGLVSEPVVAAHGGHAGLGDVPTGLTGATTTEAMASFDDAALFDILFSGHDTNTSDILSAVAQGLPCESDDATLMNLDLADFDVAGAAEFPVDLGALFLPEAAPADLPAFDPEAAALDELLLAELLKSCGAVQPGFVDPADLTGAALALDCTPSLASLDACAPFLPEVPPLPTGVALAPASPSPAPSTSPSPSPVPARRSRARPAPGMGAAADPRRPHACPLCPWTFTLKHHLKSHMGTHGVGEQGCGEAERWECPLCPGKKFTRKYDLERHERRHSGAKPYACGCGERFARQDHFKKHVRESGHAEA